MTSDDAAATSTGEVLANRIQIVVGGRTYTSWDDVPEDVRQTLLARLPDNDGNGIPDALEGHGFLGLGGLLGEGGEPTVLTSSSVSVDGTVVDQLSALPPAAVAAMRQAGFGDLLDRILPAAAPPSETARSAAPEPAAPLAAHQVVINGKVVDVDSAGAVPAESRRWWQFWK